GCRLGTCGRLPADNAHSQPSVIRLFVPAGFGSPHDREARRRRSPTPERSASGGCGTAPTARLEIGNRPTLVQTRHSQASTERCREDLPGVLARPGFQVAFTLVQGTILRARRTDSPDRA